MIVEVRYRFGTGAATRPEPSSLRRTLLWFLYLCARHRFRPKRTEEEEEEERRDFFVGGKLDCRRTEVLCNEETPERICKRILPVVMLLLIRFFCLFLFHDVLRKFRTVVFSA